MGVVRELAGRSYTNVMELLVAEEVERQLGKLPTRLLKYVKRVEVETFALNCLPSFYASSEKGWQFQYEKAAKRHGDDIKSAVKRAIAAVQRDPIRSSNPLPIRRDSESQELLEIFRKMLRQHDLTWEEVLRKCKQALTRVSEPFASSSTGSARNPGTASTGMSSSSSSTSSSGHSHVWRPGTYGGETSWRPKRSHGFHAPQPPSTPPSYDWSESAYR